MFDSFITWFRETIYPGEGKPAPDLRETGVRVRTPAQRDSGAKAAPSPKKAAEKVRFESEMGGRIEDAGPGKNVFVRSKYVREDAGTHDQLKIIGEDKLEVAEDDGGIDPYNTGQFDRSKSWNNRSRK